jgi:hypothetical protein
MRKSNNSISLQGIKRYNKNLKRKQRNNEKLDKHVDFLYKVLQSHTLDFDKLETKMVQSKITGSMETTYRNPKETKLIIDKLVSRGR